MESVHLGNLGLAYAALGEARKAIDYYEQTLTIDREIGNRRGEGADLGETRKDIDCMKAAYNIFKQIESPNAE